MGKVNVTEEVTGDRDIRGSHWGKRYETGRALRRTVLGTFRGRVDIVRWRRCRKGDCTYKSRDYHQTSDCLDMQEEGNRTGKGERNRQWESESQGEVLVDLEDIEGEERGFGNCLMENNSIVKRI